MANLSSTDHVLDLSSAERTKISTVFAALGAINPNGSVVQIGSDAAAGQSVSTNYHRGLANYNTVVGPLVDPLGNDHYYCAKDTLLLNNNLTAGNDSITMDGLTYEVTYSANNNGYTLQLTAPSLMIAEALLTNEYYDLISTLPVTTISGGTIEELEAQHAAGLSALAVAYSSKVATFNSHTAETSFYETVNVQLAISEDGWTFGAYDGTYESPRCYFSVNFGANGAGETIPSLEPYVCDNNESFSSGNTGGLPKGYYISCVHRAVYLKPTSSVGLFRPSDGTSMLIAFENRYLSARALLTADYNAKVNALQTEVITEILENFPGISWGTYPSDTLIDMSAALAALDDRLGNNGGRLRVNYPYLVDFSESEFAIENDPTDYEISSYTVARFNADIASLQLTAMSLSYKASSNLVVSNSQLQFEAEVMRVITNVLAEHYISKNPAIEADILAAQADYAANYSVRPVTTADGIMPTLLANIEEFKDYHLGTLVISLVDIGPNLFNGTQNITLLKDIVGGAEVIGRDSLKRIDNVLIELSKGKCILGTSLDCDFTFAHTASLHGFNVVFVYPEDNLSDVVVRTSKMINALAKDSRWLEKARSYELGKIAGTLANHVLSFSTLGTHMNEVPVYAWSESKIRDYYLEADFNV